MVLLWDYLCWQNACICGKNWCTTPLKRLFSFFRCEIGGQMARCNTIRQKNDSLKIWMTVLEEVRVVRPQYAEFCCSDTCQMLVNWEVVIQRSFTAQEMFCSDLYWYEVSSSKFRGYIFQFYSHWVIWGEVSSQRSTSVSVSPSLALGRSEFAAKVLRRRLEQPVGVHQTQVSHVAAGRVQQLVEHHVCWLGLEKDGGGVDGHGLVCVQSQVAAVRLELRSVYEHPVGEAVANVPRVRPTWLQLQIQLVKQQNRICLFKCWFTT